MGKLHKIRRAIHRDPQSWIEPRGRFARSANLYEHPVKPRQYHWHQTANQRIYVRKVLRDLGYDVR
jgi:hypothetical protein